MKKVLPHRLQKLAEVPTKLLYIAGRRKLLPLNLGDIILNLHTPLILSFASMKTWSRAGSDLSISESFI